MQAFNTHEAAVSLFPSFVRPDASGFGSSTHAVSGFHHEFDELALDVAAGDYNFGDDNVNDNEAAESELMNELSSVRTPFVWAAVLPLMP